MDMTGLAILQKKYDDLANELTSITDNTKRIVLQKELARLLRIIDAHKDLAQCDELIAEAKNQLIQNTVMQANKINNVIQQRRKKMCKKEMKLIVSKGVLHRQRGKAKKMLVCGVQYV